MDLPAVVKEMLQKVLAKTEAELLEADKDLLLARRDYLTPEQRAKYPTVLGATPTQPAQEEKKSDVPTQPAGTQYIDPATNQPAVAPAPIPPVEPTAPATDATQPSGENASQPSEQPATSEQAAPSEPAADAVEVGTEEQAVAPTHDELLAEANSLNIELEGNESDEQLAEFIAAAKEEDLAKAAELGIDTTGMDAVAVMHAVAEKEAEKVGAAGEEATNGQSEEPNPYGAGNADPDQAIQQ